MRRKITRKVDRARKQWARQLEEAYNRQVDKLLKSYNDKGEK